MHFPFPNIDVLLLMVPVSIGDMNELSMATYMVVFGPCRLFCLLPLTADLSVDRLRHFISDGFSGMSDNPLRPAVVDFEWAHTPTMRLSLSLHFLGHSLPYPQHLISTYTNLIYSLSLLYTSLTSSIFSTRPTTSSLQTMNVFQNAGIGGLGSNFNRRRTRDARDGGGSDNGKSGSSSSTIVAITDKQTKSLLRERDAKIAALEKEVLMLKNKISGFSNSSKEQMLMMGQRSGKKGLTPYGNTVRVSTSKCSAKRRQVSLSVSSSSFC